MPHHKSCKKRLKQAAKSKIRNTGQKTILRKAIKNAREALDKGEKLDLNQIYSRIDAGSGKGIIHKNKAARLKSRLAKAAARKADA